MVLLRRVARVLVLGLGLVNFVVSEIPVLQPLLIPSGLSLGDRADVVCTLKRGSLPVFFTWKRNGEELLLENANKVHAYDRRSFVYLGEGIQAEDIGNYSCTATNNYGANTVNGMLLVEVAPFWTKEPEDTKAAMGSRVRMDCSATAHPYPRITWTRQAPDGHVTLVKNESRHELFANGTMIIYELEESDGGKYTCDVSNGIGDGLRKEILLYVHTPPRMKEGFRSVTVRRGQTAKLECDVLGDLPLDVIWYRRKQRVEPQTGSRYEVGQETQEDGVKAILTVHATQPSDAGLYLCRVNNMFGDAQGRVKILVQEPPEPPSGLEVIQISSRSAKISWQLSLPRSLGDSPILSHLLRFWNNNDSTKELQQMTLTDVDTIAELQNLRPGTSYMVQVLAENEVGYSEPSETLDFTTQEEVPIGAPSGVRVEGLNSTTIRVVWEAPEEEKWNGFLQGFKVGYRPEDNEVDDMVFETVTGSDQTSVEISNLASGTRYQIVIKAFNGAGSGPESAPVTIETSEKDPPEPPIVDLIEVTSNSAMLKIQSASATQFVLEYRKEDDEWKLLHIAGDKTSFLLSGLDSGTDYQLRLAAFNEFGQGQFGTPMIVTTSEMAEHDASSIVAGESRVSNFFLPYVIIPIAATLVILVISILVGLICYRRFKRKHDRMALKSEITPNSTRTSFSKTSCAANTTYTRADAYDAPWNMNGEENSRFGKPNHRA